MFRSQSLDNVDADEERFTHDGDGSVKQPHSGGKNRVNDYENSFTTRRASTGTKPPLKPKPPIRTRGLSAKKAPIKGQSVTTDSTSASPPSGIMAPSVIGNQSVGHGVIAGTSPQLNVNIVEGKKLMSVTTKDHDRKSDVASVNHSAAGSQTGCQSNPSENLASLSSSPADQLSVPVRPARRPRPKSAGNNKTTSTLRPDEFKNNQIAVKDATTIANVQNQEKKDYWREYEEKYGRLGIMDDVALPLPPQPAIGDNNDVVAKYTAGKYSNDFVEREKESLSRSASPTIIVTNSDAVDDHGEKTLECEQNDMTVALINETDDNLAVLPPVPPKTNSQLRPSTLDFGSAERLTGSPDAGCPEKTEVLLAQYRKKIGRPRGRSVSDLGFSLYQKGSNAIPTPRTAALLNNPSMRKHLSKVLHVDEGNLCSNDFSWDFRLKMAHLAASSPNSSPTESANSTPKLLRSSASEPRLGSLTDRPPDGRSKSSSSSSYESLSIDIPSFALDIEGPRSARDPNEVPVSRRSFRSPFSLPSFEEFKSLRRSGVIQPCSPLYQNENSIKEEDESDIRGQRSPEIRSHVQGHDESEHGKTENFVSEERNCGQDSRASDNRRRSFPGQGQEPGQRGQLDQVDGSERTARTSHDLVNRHRKESRRKRRASEGDSEVEVHSSLDDLQKHLRGRLPGDDLERYGHGQPPPSRSPADPAKVEIVLHNVTQHGGVLETPPKVPSSKVTSKPPLPNKPKVKASFKPPVKSLSTEAINSADEQQSGSVRNLVGQFEKRSSSLESCDYDALSKGDSANKVNSGKLQRREAFLRKRHSEGDEVNKRRPSSVVIESSELSTVNLRARPKSVIGLEGCLDDAGLYVSDDTSTSEVVIAGEARRVSRDEEEAEVRRNSAQSVASSSVTSESLSPDASNVDAFSVLRSTSDVSDLKAEEGRKKGMKDKRIKPYKSDPQCGVLSELRPASPPLCHATPEQIRSERSKRCSMSSTREDILGFLHDIRQSGSVPIDEDDGSQSSFDSGTDDDDLFSEVGRYSYRLSRSSSHSSWKSRSSRSRKGSYCGGEVERVDSGVGSDIKEGAFIKRAGSICEDCDHELDATQSERDDFICKRCVMRRRERKETIQEIVDTECSYGNDLTIIKQEFYTPMKTAGLISKQQLHTIFSNIDELMRVNTHFIDQLKDALEMANEQGDEDYMRVDIGRLFVNASNMLMAFEEYCVGRSMALGLLEQLERDRELLRIFLHVSQIEKSQLRRMGLKAFLMLPVQRVMKYPLLLGRIYKLTPPSHPDKEMVKKAQVKIEEILEHINKKTKGAQDSMNLRLRRKFSSFKRSFQIAGPIEKSELLKISLELLSWSKSDVSCILVGRLHCTQPTDHLWTKKIRTLKYTNVHALLLTLGTPEDVKPQGMFGHQPGVKEAALVLLKEKGAKIVSLREPLLLSKCVVSMDADCDEVFEVMDSNKEAYLLKSDDPAETLQWLSNVRHQSRRLGQWRKRRNALPNIMVQLAS